MSSSAMALVPVIPKIGKEGENERLDYAVSAMQGHREKMEDAHMISINLDDVTDTSFFGVYDGHGGPAVSKYCARHLHIELRKHENFHDDVQTAIERTFLRMDEMMKDRRSGKELSGYGGNDNWKAYRKAMRMRLFLPFCQKPAYWGPENDGCTACVVLIRGNQIIVGNAGDSRCVLSRNNQVIDLSTDFKPNLPAERQRIEAAGHAVTSGERGNVHRIDDGIAISRSLGDLLYKSNHHLNPLQQAVTAFPEVRTEEITQDDQFLIIASAGIWECMTSHEAVDFVKTYLSAGLGLKFICEALLGHCLSQPGGRDNMTVILVWFKTSGACQVRAHNILLPPQSSSNQVPPSQNLPGLPRNLNPPIPSPNSRSPPGNNTKTKTAIRHLSDNLVMEILAYLPGDEPATLVNAACVCRRWRRLMSTAYYRRRFRELHHEVPNLGLLCNERLPTRCRYIRMLPFVPSCNSFTGWWAIDARHSIVLLHQQTVNFRVWGPTTGEELLLPQLEFNPIRSWCAALLCDAPCSCTCLLNCQFRVILLATDNTSMFSSIYSSAQRGWSPPTSVPIPNNERLLRVPAARVQNTLFFRLHHGRILMFDLAGGEPSIIQRPAGVRPFQGRPLLMNWEGGYLGFAIVREDTVSIWVREISASATWEMSRTIDLSTRMPSTSLLTLPELAGFASETGMLYVWTAVSGLFQLDVNSDETMHLKIGSNPMNSILPYLAYYIPAKIPTYPVLNNRSIDKLMASELVDELKRRYLPVTGQRVDLLKSLFEAMHCKIPEGEGN